MDLRVPRARDSFVAEQLSKATLFGWSCLVMFPASRHDRSRRMIPRWSTYLHRQRKATEGERELVEREGEHLKNNDISDEPIRFDPMLPSMILPSRLFIADG